MRTADYLDLIRGQDREDETIEPPTFRIGVIPSSYSSGNPRVRFEGEASASSKTYKYLSPYTPTADDRVLLARVGNSYVILGEIV